MHSKILALAAGLSLAASVSAQAMPVGTVAAPSSPIQKTAEGCGRGFAPSPSGVCRPIERRVVVVPERRVVVVPERRVVVRPAPCAGIRVGPVAVRGC